MAVAPSTGKRLTTEFLGTFVLVSGGAQLWLFLLAPIAGGLIAGLTYATLLGDEDAVGLPEAMET